MGLSDPVGELARLDSLTDAQRALIEGATAARLLHI